MAIFQVDKVSNLDDALTRDLNLTGKYAVLRTSESTGKIQVWSTHKTVALAMAAKRRWASREVRTP